MMTLVIKRSLLSLYRNGIPPLKQTATATRRFKAAAVVVPFLLFSSTTSSRTMATPTDPLSSLTGMPVKALVPPGKCQFTEEFVSVPLLERTQVSSTSSVFRFGLPDKTKPLNLSTCACILAKAKCKTPEGTMEDVIRPYTPISTNAMVGSFDLLIKNYGEKARMSRHLNEMPIGDTVEFKHIPFNVKSQAPFAPKKIGMLVGGTGITPMIQALHAILGDKESDQEVVMLYGSQNSSDILGRQMIDAWAKEYPQKFKLVHVLSCEPEESDWAGERGTPTNPKFIDRAMCEKYLPQPSEESCMIFVCGPPPMYNALCGPREEKDITGVLGQMGYSQDQVYKF